MRPFKVQASATCSAAEVCYNAVPDEKLSKVKNPCARILSLHRSIEHKACNNITTRCRLLILWSDYMIKTYVTNAEVFCVAIKTYRILNI